MRTRCHSRKYWLPQASGSCATASSATTRAARSRACPPPPVPVRPPSFSASFTPVRPAATAGANPHTSPVNTASPSAKTTTFPSRPMELTRGRVSGRKLIPTRSATQARASPMRPPQVLSSNASTSDWRRTATPLAPRARRTAISRRRRITRTSSSPARLAQAMNRTTVTAKKSVLTSGRACATVASSRRSTSG